PLAFDPLQHAVDFRKEVGRLSSPAPILLRYCDETLSERATDRPGTRQGLDFPELGTVSIIRFVSAQGCDERPLFAVRSKPGVERGYQPFRCRLGGGAD